MKQGWNTVEQDGSAWFVGPNGKVRVYDASGGWSFDASPEQWLEVLEAAVIAGWKPAGQVDSDA